MDFPRLLKMKQLELGMTVTEFAKYLGKSRQFVTTIYSKNPNSKKYGLSDLTMYGIHMQFGIPFDVMEEYNKEVKAHNGRIKKSTGR